MKQLRNNLHWELARPYRVYVTDYMAVAVAWEPMRAGRLGWEL